MHPKLRDFFDVRLESVLASMPARIHQLLERVPLHVEDYPSDEVLAAVGVEHRDALCGLHTGVPLTSQKTMQPLDGITDPNAVTIYREGVLGLASDAQGNLDEAELRRQIKITLLHELGHYHGMDEDELESLGYG